MKNSFGNSLYYLFMLFQFCLCISTVLCLNNKPCCEPRLVSSVMADYIDTYYFLYRVLSITFIMSLQEIYF